MLREELSKISKIADESECANNLENLKQEHEHTISVLASKILTWCTKNGSLTP